MKIRTGQRTYYSDRYKLRIVQEVLSGSIGKEAVQRKYGIKGHSAIINWMRSFGIKEPLKRPIVLQQHDPENEDKKPLKQKIKELQEALKLAELKVEAYSKMIDIAEEEFKIPIRKKLPTKRSGK